MENSKKNIVTVGGAIILVLSVFIFVFLPVFDGPNGGNQRAVIGKWKGKVLDNTPDGLFMREYQRLHRSAEQEGYLNSDNKLQREVLGQQIRRSAFTASMIELAAQQEVLAAGFHLSNKAINEALIPFYSDSSGAYSAKLYAQTSEQMRLQNRRFVIDYLTSQRYKDDLFGSYDKKFGLKMSSKEAAFIKKMAENKRIFHYVVFEETQFPQEKIKVYGAEHKELFAEHHLQMLTFTAEDEAKKVLQTIQKNELTFEDAAAAHSTKQGTDASGNMLSGYRTAVNRTFPESSVLETVLGLKEGELSPVIKTVSGYAIVKCTAPETPADFSLQETVDRVFTYMKTHERGTIEDYLEKKAKEFAAAVKAESDENAFSKKAGQEGLDIQTSSSLALNYGNLEVLPRITTQTDTFFASVARNETFFKSLFALKPAELSEPILLNTSVAVFQFAEESKTEEEELNRFSTVYEQYASFWNYNYASALFAFQPLPWGQQTFIDFIVNSKHFVNFFDTAMQ